jgi:hypothetical protein
MYIRIPIRTRAVIENDEGNRDEERRSKMDMDMKMQRREQKGVFQLYKQYPVTLDTVRDANMLYKDMVYLNETHSKDIFAHFGIDEEMVHAYLGIVETLETLYKSIDIEEC